MAMTEDQATTIIAQAFKALTPEQLGNLRWHAENGTRVLCNHPNARTFYTSGSGYG